MIGTKPYAELKYREVNGKRMAYIDEGEGDAIVFQHGQPASSYVWRNIMPHLEGVGRLIACDLIGMGSSEKLTASGPGRYSYAEHRVFLFALWDALDLGDRVVLVLDDWGATLGFDWANTHRRRVLGIVHMEAITVPMRWSDLADQAQPFFRLLPSRLAAVHESVIGVRRDKAALSSGCKPHPATAPAGSNRSSHGGNEVAEAFD
jgi:haloalkane dehalogenase